MKVAYLGIESCLLTIRKLPTFYTKVAYFPIETWQLSKTWLSIILSNKIPIEADIRK